MQIKCRLFLRNFAVFLAISVCTVFFTACDDGTRDFRITFQANGATSGTPPDPQVAVPGSTITLPGVGGLLRSGFTFGGWNINADGTGTNFTATMPVAGDTRLYARWIPVMTYTVIFNANGGTGAVPAQTMHQGVGITIPDAGELARSGFTFGGWNTRPDGTGNNFDPGDTFVPTADITLFARWVGTFTVTFNSNEGIGTVSARTATQGNSITIPSDSGISRSGFVFGGWNTKPYGTGNNFDPGETFVPTADTTLFARWQIAFTVSFDANGGTGMVPARVVNMGSSLILPGGGGFSRTGFIFEGWNARADGTGANFNAGTTFTPTDNITLYARWHPGWASVSVGGSRTVAIGMDGSLWSWGSNARGGTGLGETTGNIAIPTQVLADKNWAYVSVGSSYYTVAITASKWFWAWGTKENRIVLTPSSPSPILRPPIMLPSWTTGSAGGPGNHVYQVLYFVYYGAIPSQIDHPMEGWASVSAGRFHTLAIKADGTLWAWGYNGSGQLGDGTTTNRLSPVQIGTATNWASVSAGVGHSVAVRTDGTLWVWGFNGSGQLGDGTTTNRLSPVRIGTAANWATVSAGGGYSVAIRTDGTLWAWGNNGSGQLGDGTTTGRLSPVRIGTATNWAFVSTGADYTLAIRTDGTLWAWGHNGSGQLGNGTTVNLHSPVRIGTATNWASVSACTDHTLAIRTDGTLWAWGNNASGQLGDGTTTNRRSPVQIAMPR